MSSPCEGQFVQRVVLLMGELETVFQIGVGGLQVADGRHLLLDERLVGGDDAVDEVGVGCREGGRFQGRGFRLGDHAVLEGLLFLQHHRLSIIR